jgi:hypothetical protein
MSGPVVLTLRILMGLSLYLFLAWALWTLWRDLRQQGLRAAGQRAPRLSLVSEGGFGEHHFTHPEILIGRDPANDVPIIDKTVSTRHARLAFHHRQWWLEDLDSTNGTFLNQEQVTTPTVIATGDQLRCGQVLFSISIEDQES